jgi:hypothetical protein
MSNEEEYQILRETYEKLLQKKYRNEEIMIAFFSMAIWLAIEGASCLEEYEKIVNGMTKTLISFKKRFIQ